MGARCDRDCVLCGRHGMDTPRNQSHSRFGNERPEQVGGCWSSVRHGGLSVFCLGRPPAPKENDRVKLTGHRQSKFRKADQAAAMLRSSCGSVPLLRCPSDPRRPVHTWARTFPPIAFGGTQRRYSTTRHDRVPQESRPGTDERRHVDHPSTRGERLRPADPVTRRARQQVARSPRHPSGGTGPPPPEY